MSTAYDRFLEIQREESNWPNLAPVEHVLAGRVTLSQIMSPRLRDAARDLLDERDPKTKRPLRTFWVTWTYVGNYGGPWERTGYDEEQVAKQLADGFSPDFAKRGKVHVFSSAPVSFDSKSFSPPTEES